MKMWAAPAALLVWSVAWSVPGVEAAPEQKAALAYASGLHRCVGANGVMIFTDRRCQDVQAVETFQTASANPNRLGYAVRTRTCARSQDDLLYGVRSALENGDANRLADFYHWTGMGTAQGYRLMERLGSFSKRPVVDVQLVSGVAEQEYSSEELGYASYAKHTDGEAYDAMKDSLDEYLDSDADGVTDSETDTAAEPGVAPASIEPPRRRRPAHLLRVDQMRGTADIASETTYFHLLSNAGCWWMQF